MVWSFGYGGTRAIFCHYWSTTFFVKFEDFLFWPMRTGTIHSPVWAAWIVPSDPFRWCFPWLQVVFSLAWTQLKTGGDPCCFCVALSPLLLCLGTGCRDLPRQWAPSPLLCLRRSLWGCDCQLTLELDMDNRRLLTLSTVLGMYIPITVPIPGALSWMQPWGSNVLLRPSGLYTWLNAVKAL